MFCDFSSAFNIYLALSAEGEAGGRGSGPVIRLDYCLHHLPTLTLARTHHFYLNKQIWMAYVYRALCVYKQPTYLLFFYISFTTDTYISHF